MADHPRHVTRRSFLAKTAGLTAAGGIVAQAAATPRPAIVPKIAVLGSVWRSLSYLDLLASRFVHGYSHPGDGPAIPQCKLGRVWLDQSPANDLSPGLAAEFGFRRCRTICDALDGDPAGVFVVAEHGNYPRTENGQVAYPRHVWLREVADSFARTGRVVPVFVAKHLAYRPEDAWEAYRWAAGCAVPLMAGSVVPHAAVVGDAVPPGEPIREALVVAHGPIEVGGIDALEAVQSLVERRPGGEAGLAAVSCLSGPAVWQARESGRWDRSLLAEALAHAPSAAAGDPARTVGTVALPGMPATPPLAFVLEYRDGLTATVLLLNGHMQDVTYAVRGERSRFAGRFDLGALPAANHFDRLAAALDRFVIDRRTPQPLERTLFATLAMHSLMHSNRPGGRRLTMTVADTIAY